MTPDQELLSFASQVLEQHGAAIEQHPDYLVSLLPIDLCQILNLPEETRIGEDGVPLIYGSPLLDRLVTLATKEVPVVYGELQVPYLKQEGFEQLLAQDISFGKGKSRIVDTVEARHPYMILTCHYVAMSDERKEGLIELAIHEDSGALIPEMSGCWKDFQPRFFAQQYIPPHFPAHIDSSINAALKSARSMIDNELADFYKSITRHLNRDVQNTQEYYKALKREMEASLQNPNLSQDQRNDRMAKIKDLPEEMNRKIEDLQQKYQIHVTTTACAALRFLIPIVRLTIEFRYKKLLRELRLNYNPLSRSLDPLVCEHCKLTTRTVFPCEKKSELWFYCPECCE
ncbi:MAG: hypothetical protein JSW07_13115 [bacterium]|nr:MAG: hypothetical protein JSW07_13115 [bacterium]